MFALQRSLDPSSHAARAVVALAAFLATGASLLLAPQDATGETGATNGFATTLQAADTIQPIPLEPMEVTVLRTPVTQEASPLAVGVLSEVDLRRGRSGVFLEEALQGLPGVQVQNRFNPAVGERVAIRGFGARAQFGLRGIRVMVDGIPATLPDGQSSLDHLDIGSLGRAEVIRGPASALYGNASGGVLALTTRDPAQGPAGVEVENVVGSHGLLRSQATVSGTVQETGYLITGSFQNWDGFRSIEPGSQWEDEGTNYGAAERLGLNARVTHPVAGGELSFTGNVLDLDAENPGSIADDFRDGADRDVNDLYLRFGTGKQLSQQQAGLRWNGPLGDALEGDVSIFGIRRNIINPIPFNVIDLSRGGGGLRAQLRHTAETGLGDLEWHVGAEYEMQSDDRLEWAAEFGTGAPAPDAAPYVNQEETVRMAGVFLQGNLELPGGMMALAGLRYDNHHFEAEDRIPPTGTDPDITGSRSMDRVSPSIGLSMPLGDDFNAFGSVSTVFETPTTVELGNHPDPENPGGFNQDLEPAHGESYELGVRGSLAEGAAVEVTVFQTDLSNELVPFEIEEAAGITFFRNAGSSRHRGAEATLSLASQTGLVRGDLTYAYIDARFQEYTLEAGDDEVDYADNRVPGLAPQRAQARVRFSPEAWFGEIVGSYVDNVQVNDANEGSAPSYALVDLRAGLDDLQVGNINVAPWAAVTNVFDEGYISSVAVNATGARYYEPGPGRSFQLGLRAAWGGN